MRHPVPAHPVLTRLALPLGLLALGAAAPAAPAGNVATGQKQATFCASCHGPDGNLTHTGTPRLAGQPAEALIAKMMVYRAGQRVHHPMMGLLAHSLTDQDIADLAAFYAAQTPTPSLKRYGEP
ncbi:MAG: cytochrome c [Thiobacillaceae bacterium]|nr:cytochrome c [Thiobacillaceae bacterium]